MDEQMAGDILGRQLKGIMFHADAMAYAVLKGWGRLAQLMEKQALEETKAHLCTDKTVIKKLGRILVTPPQARLIIPPDADQLALLNMWQAYEENTAKMYADAKTAEPTCPLWGKLHKSAMQEIKITERLVNSFTKK